MSPGRKSRSVFPFSSFLLLLGGIVVRLQEPPGGMFCPVCSTLGGLFYKNYAGAIVEPLQLVLLVFLLLRECF